MSDFIQASAIYSDLTPSQQREQYYVSVEEYYHSGCFLLDSIRFFLTPTYLDTKQENITGMSLEEKIDHNTKVDSLREEWNHIFKFVQDKTTDKNLNFYIEEIMDPIFERISSLYEESSDSMISDILPRLDILGRLQALYVLSEIDEDKIKNSSKAHIYRDSMDRARSSVDNLSHTVLYDDGLSAQQITSIVERTESFCEELVKFANHIIDSEEKRNYPSYQPEIHLFKK